LRFFRLIAIFPAMRVLSGYLRKGIKFKTDLVIRKRKEIRRRRRRRKEEEKEKEKEKEKKEEKFRVSPVGIVGMLKDLNFSDQIDFCTGVGGLIVCLLGGLICPGIRCPRLRQVVVVFGLLAVNGLLGCRVATYFVCRAVRRGRRLEAAVWVGVGAGISVWAPGALQTLRSVVEYGVFWALINCARSEDERVWLRVFVQVLAGCPLGLHGVELYAGFLQD
jgi:hypothetical protein